MELPRVFVGSSREGLEVARAIQTQLSDSAEVQLWNEGVFGLNEGTLEALLNALRQFHIAVFVLTPDDVLISRSSATNAARDNVLLELGMFLGHLGRDHVLALCSRNTKLPSDLAGVTVERFEHPGDTARLLSAVGPACNRIRPAIQRCADNINRRASFRGFFGEHSLDAPYPAIFLDAQLPHVGDTDLCIVQLGNPPQAIGLQHPAPLPKGIHQIVPYKEVEAILALDRLFRDFDGNVVVRKDEFHPGGSDLPKYGGLAVGLGFNNATVKLGEVSQLYKVLYESGTDDFCIFSKPGKRVVPALQAGEEYALLARILMSRGSGKPTPYLVCAGHTADGTVAACHYLVENWSDMWRNHQNLLADHHMAAILVHPIGVRDCNQRVVGPYFKALEQSSFAARKG